MSMIEYITFHKQMIDAHDLDPYFPFLKAYSDLMQLSTGERIALAFLFAMTYSAPTACYLQSLTGEMSFDSDFWQLNKYKLVFGPDRMRVKSNDMFLPAWADWQGHIDYNRIFTGYNFACKLLQKHIQYMGPFAAGLMVETVMYLCPEFELKKETINWAEAKSSRTGLYYVFDIPYPEAIRVNLGAKLFMDLYKEMVRLQTPDEYMSLANLESTLCIYKNFKRGHRWVGYYIERQRQELVKMEQNYPEWEWGWAWDFREEYFDKQYLRELD
jgi:hypothetical protein